jgi:hypothetical protein
MACFDNSYIFLANEEAAHVWRLAGRNPIEFRRESGPQFVSASGHGGSIHMHADRKTEPLHSDSAFAATHADVSHEPGEAPHFVRQSRHIHTGVEFRMIAGSD